MPGNLTGSLVEVKGWRLVRLQTLARAAQMGWTWTSDVRRGPAGRALRSTHGTVYEFRLCPLSLRRFREPWLRD